MKPNKKFVIRLTAVLIPITLIFTVIGFLIVDYVQTNAAQRVFQEIINGIIP